MNDTRQAIMNHAENLVRTKGANGFSYADLAQKLDIRKASIHYHFATKNELLENLIQRYYERHMQSLSDIDGLAHPQAKLAAFVDIYKQGVKTDALCLCGMLTLDSGALTGNMREQLDLFFQDTAAWLTTVCDEGQSEAQWQLNADAALEAKAFLALVQGAQLISRHASKPVAMFEEIVNQKLVSYS